MTTTLCWTHPKMTTVVCLSLQNIVLSVGNLQSDVVFQSIYGVRFIPGHVKSGNQGSCSSVEQWCMPLSAICWGCSKLFMHSTSMNRHASAASSFYFWSFVQELQAKASQMFCMNHFVYKDYSIQCCRFACCCSMGKKLRLSRYGNNVTGWGCWGRWESKRTLQDITFEELLHLCFLPNINWVVKWGKMKWAAHSTCGKKRSACKVMLRKPTRRRWLGIARHIWTCLCA
jgi:hypothetical protein